MKHFLPKYLCFFFLLTLWLSVGKVLAQVTSITVPGVSVPLTKSTETDSVTVGSTMPYYTMPDVNFNPAYSATSPMNNVESSFDWSATPSSGCKISAVSSYTSVTNYKNINWSSTGAYSIGVTETSASTYGGCSGTTSFNVQVIDAPTAKFSQLGSLVCPSATVVSLPLTVTSSVAGTTEKQLQFTFNYQYNGGTIYPISTDATSYALGSGSVTPTLTPSSLSEGIYTFTLTGVSDRISRKCNVSGNVAAQPTFKVYVTTPKPTLSTSAVK